MLRTRRWNDPPEPDDGARLLVTRYRPRGRKKADETWDEWWKELAPSAPLLAAYHEGLDWDAYRQRYLEEMSRSQALFRIRALRNRLAAGESVTLLCSAACTDPARCHRTLLADLLTRRK
jgi:uncharacterized protein YeaO (DUF488 family)